MNEKQSNTIFKSKSDAGKGDKPRNLSALFSKNYDQIDWTAHKKDKNSPKKNWFFTLKSVYKI